MHGYPIETAKLLLEYLIGPLRPDDIANVMLFPARPSCWRRIRCRRRAPTSPDDATAFTDASAWFWAGRLGRSRGRWQAITIATPIGAAS